VPVVTPYMQYTVPKSIKLQTQLVLLRMFTFGNSYFKCPIHINVKLGPSISGKETERVCLGYGC